MILKTLYLCKIKYINKKKKKKERKKEKEKA